MTGMDGAIGEALGIRFGSFEVDLQARELRKGGMRRRLQRKPFQILELLLSKAGEVVTRTELRRNLWPDSYVGFDRSLNTAIHTLRRTLGDSAGSPRFVETCQRHGYRFIAPIERLDHSPGHETRVQEIISSIAVLPFRNETRDPELEYLSDGLTESIISTLSQLPGLRVMARSTVFCYKGREVDPLRIGRELSVSAVLVARVLQRGDALQVDIELVDASRGWHLWGEQYHRRHSDLFRLEEEISRDLSMKLRLRLTSAEKKRLARHETQNSDACRDYLT